MFACRDEISSLDFKVYPDFSESETGQEQPIIAQK